MKSLSELVRWVQPRTNSPANLLLELTFGRVRVHPEWVVGLREAAAQGTVVHVMRAGGAIDLLCLDHACKRSGLPRIAYTNGTGGAAVGALLVARDAERIPPGANTPPLEAAIVAGGSALLFLRTAKSTTDPDPLLSLIATQRMQARPILLVPQTLVWSKRASRKRRTLADIAFGSAEDPGALRQVAQLALSPGDALLQAGPAFDLRAFLLANPQLSDQMAAAKVAYALLRRTERERTVVLGPRIKSPARMRDEILRSRRLRPHLESAARSSQTSLAQVTARAASDLDDLIAAPSAVLLGLMNRGLDRVWNQLYDGLVVDEEGMSRIREASRRGTLVLFPSHKSHIDYVVLSDVFYARGLSPPVVAAGDNLNFWPLGPALRRAGAFFIHRELAGQKLYSALLATYIRRLLLEGFTLEVFLEGGRSRTGKLLTPKLGVLSMIVDAALALHGRPVYFVPISIAYERVIEEGSFVRELAGAEKEGEDIAGLLQTPKAFRSRYGRLFLQVGSILPFNELLDEVAHSVGSTRGDTLSPKARRTLIHTIAVRTAHEINRVTMVTPSALTATALLCHRKRGLTKSDIVDIARSMLSAVVERGARVAGSLTDPTSPRVAVAVSEALQLFVDGKLVVQRSAGPETVYRVPSEQRVAVEYYKNSILHFFAPSALIATVLTSTPSQPVSHETTIAEASALREKLALELMIVGDGPAPFEAAVATMIRSGELVATVNGLQLTGGTGGQRVPHYAWMIRGSLESLRVALRAALMLTSRAIPLKAFIKDAIATGERMYLAGAIETREAVSRERLDNAVHALHAMRIVRLQSNQSVCAGPDLSTLRVDEEDAALRRYLP